MLYHLLFNSHVQLHWVRCWSWNNWGCSVKCAICNVQCLYLSLIALAALYVHISAIYFTRVIVILLLFHIWHIPCWYWVDCLSLTLFLFTLEVSLFYVHSFFPDLLHNFVFWIFIYNCHISCFLSIKPAKDILLFL